MQDALVDRIAARVALLLEGRPIDTSPRDVFVVFSGAVSGFAAGREAVARLVRSHHVLTILLTPSAREIFGEGPLRQAGAASIVDLQPWTDVSEYTRRADLVLVPTLTMNLAAKLALGLMENPAATLILGSLLAGKRVLAVRDGADPAGKRGEALGAVPEGSPALWSLFVERLATLERFGVELSPKDDFLYAMERALITPPGRREASVAPVVTLAPTPAGREPAIVTAGDIMGLAPGAMLRLTRGRRLTPQAADAATRLGLDIRYV